MNRFYATTGLVLTFITGVMIYILCSCTTISQKDYEDTLERANVQSYINACHAQLLHRIWLENPTYVEDILSESDEWQEYLEAINGDTEDIFFFWSDEDSIQYNLAKEIEQENADIIIRHRAKSVEPDTLLQQRYVR